MAAMGKNISWKKIKGEAILSSLLYLGCLEEYHVGKKGEGDGNIEEDNQLINFGFGEEYRVVGNLIQPCLLIGRPDIPPLSLPSDQIHLTSRHYL